MLQSRNLQTVAGVRDANGAVPSACGLCRSNGLREITSATLLCPDKDVYIAGALAEERVLHATKLRKHPHKVYL